MLCHGYYNHAECGCRATSYLSHVSVAVYARYLVLAKMLSLDQIDPFDSPEAKPYKSDRDIQAMTNLLQVNRVIASPSPTQPATP